MFSWFCANQGCNHEDVGLRPIVQQWANQVYICHPIVTVHSVVQIFNVKTHLQLFLITYLDVRKFRKALGISGVTLKIFKTDFFGVTLFFLPVSSTQLVFRISVWRAPPLPISVIKSSSECRLQNRSHLIILPSSIFVPIIF